MNILLIGGGGREHALAWKLSQSGRVDTVFVAPGNAGTAGEPGIRNVDIKVDDTEGLLAFASRRSIDLSVVGPEGPLVTGIVDAFQRAGLRCFGPTQRAARLEGSKAFAKAFLKRYRIPTAEYQTFSDKTSAQAYIKTQNPPIVIKADGLAAGKGVFIVHSVEEALDTAERMLVGGLFGKAGTRIVVESFLAGEEVSFIAIVAGSDILALASSQDHKARDAGDQGPNTGGMGAYSPAPVVDASLHERLMREIMRPTVQGLIAENIAFTGFLYAGIMVLPDGSPRVLEFNCRCGDPETQPMMLRMRSDLVDLIEAALDGRLQEAKVDWDERAALGVVLAAAGYPESYRSGDIISGLHHAESADTKVFHAGTALQEDNVVTSGGRVLCVCALGETVAKAQQSAYKRVWQINWSGRFYRQDIGYRAISRELSPSSL